MMKLILIFHVNMQHIYDTQMLPTIPFIAIKKNFEYIFYVLLNSLSKEKEKEEELSITSFIYFCVHQI